MTPSEIILLVLEIIGTVAFAVSGAFAAIKAKLDIFGVLFIGCITAVGGGITRDLLIGDTPPRIFDNLHILAIAATSAVVVFVAAYLSRKQFLITYEHFEPIQNVFDAFGLAAFSVTGTEIAFTSGLAENPVLAILLGVLTGVGGGVFRDVLTSTTPYIFKKHVYALASIGGASVYYVMRSFVETKTPLMPSLVAMVLVVLVRLLAAKYRWSLPKVKLEEEE
ncbi:MAG: TRIC cation channel family protein [Clostridia bacterium]|nr:TRIC cation channel family protein [Clostridia bacterium]